MFQEIDQEHIAGDFKLGKHQIQHQPLSKYLSRTVLGTFFVIKATLSILQELNSLQLLGKLYRSGLTKEVNPSISCSGM